MAFSIPRLHTLCKFPLSHPHCNSKSKLVFPHDQADLRRLQSPMRINLIPDSGFEGVAQPLILLNLQHLLDRGL